MSRRLGPAGRGARAALGGAVVLAGLTVCVAFLRHPHAITGVAQDAQMPPGNIAGADWRAYGGTNWGDRFSGLSEITPANVAGLKLAWQFRTGDMKGPNDPVGTTDEDAPRAIGDTLYAYSPHQSLFALDAATGQLRRKFDPKIEDNPTFEHLTCREVSYHETPAGATTIDGAPSRRLLSSGSGRRHRARAHLEL